MNRRPAALLALAAFWPAAALAQPVFFDDFDGDDLLPHWKKPPDWHWEYNVSGGMLSVTELFYPGEEHLEVNYAIIGTSYAPQTDFRIDARFGWEDGDQEHGLIFQVMGQGFIIASFWYSDSAAWGPDPVVGASASNQGAMAPAPPPGIYQFTITRTGTQFEFFLEGSHFASFTDLFGTPATGITLQFSGPIPGEFGTLYVDRIVVVPAPTALACAALTLCGARRKRP